MRQLLFHACTYLFSVWNSFIGLNIKWMWILLLSYDMLHAINIKFPQFLYCSVYWCSILSCVLFDLFHFPFSFCFIFDIFIFYISFDLMTFKHQTFTSLPSFLVFSLFLFLSTYFFFCNFSSIHNLKWNRRKMKIKQSNNIFE